MASQTMQEIAARGTVLESAGGKIIFTPINTSYRLELIADGAIAPDTRTVRLLITTKARKIWTVSSGGSFIMPLFGPPRLAQGWVLAADPHLLVVQTSFAINVELPAEDEAFDLASGPIGVGALVNVTLWPGARARLAT